MSDPFIQRMLARTQARKAQVERLSSHTDNKENATQNSTPNISRKSTFSAKQVLQSQTIDNSFSTQKKSPCKTDACAENNFTDNKEQIPTYNRTTAETSNQPTKTYLYPNLNTDKLEASNYNASEGKPKLGALARLSKQIREWDDDYTCPPKSSMLEVETPHEQNIGNVVHEEFPDVHDFKSDYTPNLKNSNRSKYNEPEIQHKIASPEPRLNVNSPNSRFIKSPEIDDRVSSKLEMTFATESISSSVNNTSDCMTQTPSKYYFGESPNPGDRNSESINTTSSNTCINKTQSPNRHTPTKKLMWDRKLISSLILSNDAVQSCLEAQGFTPSESRSRLVYDFDEDRKRARPASPIKSSKSPRNEYNRDLPTVKSTTNMTPITSPPPPPKVLSCVLKSRENSPEKMTNPPSPKRPSRDLSPSKVNQLCDQWETQIRNASPERRPTSSPSRQNYEEETRMSRRSRAELGNRMENEKNFTERSRSPVKSSNMMTQSQGYQRSTSPVKSHGYLPSGQNKMSDNQRSASPTKSFGNLPRSASPTKSFGNLPRSASPTKSFGNLPRSISPSKISTNFPSTSPNKNFAQLPTNSSPSKSCVIPRSASPTKNLCQPQGKAMKGSNNMPDVSPLISEPHKLSVKDRAAVFDQGKTETKDPTELSVHDRFGIFEKNKGAAPLIPKAPFGQPVPAKLLEKASSEQPPRFNVSYSHKVVKPPKMNLGSSLPAITVPPSRDFVSPNKQSGVEAHKRLFETPKEDNWHENEIIAKIQSERQKEMELLNNRFKKPKSAPKQPITYEETESEYVESDESCSESTTSEDLNSGPPKPPRIYVHSSSVNSNSTTDRTPSPRRARLNSTELDESPRKQYTPRIKPGCMFPCLSDIESHSEIADSQSEDDFGNSSFAESVLTCASMESLGTKIQKAAQKNTTKSLNTIAEDSVEPSSMMDMTTTTIDNMGAIDDAIEEAFSEEESPPRPGKHHEYVQEFKTPKLSSATETSSESDSSLAHSVSMYRKQRPKDISVTPIRRIIRSEENPLTPPTESPMSPTLNISENIRQLQQQESKQLSVISQTSGALSVVAQKPEQQGTLQHIEAEKLLLLATHSRQAIANEIHRLKSQDSMSSDTDNSCRGSLTISNLSLPLKDPFASKSSGNKNHHFLIVVKYRHQVISTELLTTPQCIVENRITFPNVINLHDLPSDFKVSINVYMLMIESNQNLHPFKKEQSRLKLTPLKRLHKMDSRMSPAVQSPGGPYAVRSTSFVLVGFTHLNISNLSRNAWELEKVPFSSPLDGHILMKVGCHMQGGEKESSFLTMFEDIGGFGSWNRRWCALSGYTLKYWRYPDDQNKRDPQGCLDLRNCTTRVVELVSRETCARMHTFELVIVRAASPADISNLVQEVRGSNVIVRVLLSADSKEERKNWCDKLNRTLVNLRAWDPDALRPEDFQV